MRLLLVLAIALGLLGGCAYDPGPIRPGLTATTGVSAPGPPSALTGPTGITPPFTAEGCPVNDPAFCEQATFLANGLVLGDAGAVFDLARVERLDCRHLDADTFPQCARGRTLQGYAVRTYQDQTFVDPLERFRRLLGFFVSAVDPEYQD